MRLFVRFYPVAESCQVELSLDDNFEKMIEQLYGLTNLVSGDRLKVIHNNITIANLEANLSDYDVKADDTFNIIIQKMKNEKIELNKKRDYGLTAPLKDIELVNVFAFCDAKDMVTTTAVCRPWRNISSNNELLWSFNCDELFREDTSVVLEEKNEEEDKDDDDEDEKKDKKNKAPVLRSVLFTESDPKYLQWYLERTSLRKNWKHISQFSAEKPQKIEEMPRGKLYLVQKPPKALTEEEEQFLAENNAAEMKKLVRKKKGMKEKLKKYKQLEKKKIEFDEGNWRVVPEELRNFSYNTLMSYANGSSSEEWRCYYENGKFYWAKNGKNIFIGHLQAVNTSYGFQQVEVSEDSSEGEMEDLKTFFGLFENCKIDEDFETKVLMDLRVGKEEEFKDYAKTKIVVNWSDFSALMSKPYSVEPIVDKDYATQEITSYGTNTKLYNDVGATNLNFENIFLCYSNILKTVLKEGVSTNVLINSIEDEIIKNENDSNHFRSALLENEPLSESYLRAVQQVAREQHENKSIVSPRGKKTSKGLEISRILFLFENQENCDKAIKFVKDYFSGKVELKERVKSDQPKKDFTISKKFEKSTTSSTPSTTNTTSKSTTTPTPVSKPTWKKDLSKKEEVKYEPKKETGPPSWMKKLENKKKEEPKVEEKKEEPKEEQKPAWMQKLRKTSVIEPKKEESKEEEQKPNWMTQNLKKTATPTKVEEKKEEEQKPEWMIKRDALKKTEETEKTAEESVKEEPKSIEEEKPEPTEVQPVEEEHKPEPTEEKPVEKVEEESTPVKEEKATPVEEKESSPPVEEEKSVEEKEEPKTIEEEKSVEDVPVEDAPVEETKPEEVVQPVEEETKEVPNTEETVEEEKPEPTEEEKPVEETKDEPQEEAKIEDEKESNTEEVKLEGTELDKQKLSEEAFEKKEAALESQ
eukprot:gene10812-3430_t